jgi:uroporphyrinogen-III decarboxylase
MHQRFGLGDENQQPRPIIGSMHVAGGFVIPALFGVEIKFAKNEAPWPVAPNLCKEDILGLEVPDIKTMWPMDRLIQDMDALEDEFGYVVGDFDTDGILNTALCLRGQQLLIDLVEDVDLVHHLFTVLAETYVIVANYVKSRTGTCAIATNRSIVNVDPQIYVHSNCSVQMVSPATYEESLLPYELHLAERLRPYGIHHCGRNLHMFVEAYSKVPAVFYDVGWESDVAECRRAFQDAFLNLRLSPIRMLQQTPDEIRKDTEQLLMAVGSPENVGICCINMDYETPDENVMSMLEVAGSFYESDVQGGTI